MKNWIKVAIDFLQSPKVMAAGRDGVLVYLQALATNMRGGRDGQLTPIESRPETFANLLAAYGMSADSCREALDRCLDVGLLQRLEGEALAIVGWDDEWRAVCSTCRKPNPDPTRATCPKCRAGSSNKGGGA